MPALPGLDPFAFQLQISRYLELDFVLTTARYWTCCGGGAPADNHCSGHRRQAGGLSLIPAESRCVVPRRLDPEFWFAQKRQVAFTKFIDALIPWTVLISFLARRVENYRIHRFLAPTVDFLLDHGLLPAKSFVDNSRVPCCLMPEVLLSVAIVAGPVVFREASPL